MDSTYTAADVKVAPSIMCADLLHLDQELSLLAQAQFDYIHVDIMDGHYVPNLTFGPGFCKSIARATSIPIDLHFMVENADQLIHPFLNAIESGVEERSARSLWERERPVFSIHPDAAWHPHRTIQAIRSLGARPAIAFSPSVPIGQYEMLLEEVDIALVLTVNPGYAGQALIPQALEKVTRLVELRKERGLYYEIEVDGNVSWDNIPAMIKAGADILVAGSSSLFGQPHRRKDDISRLQSLVKNR